jgi:hypothetical protein
MIFGGQILAMFQPNIFGFDIYKGFSTKEKANIC